MRKQILAAVIMCPASLTAAALSAEPIGVLLAAGDIANCYSSDTKYRETADLITNEVAAAQSKSLPIRVLVLGDLAYSDPENKKKKDRHRTHYPTCFQAFAATWGKHKDILLPVPGNHDYADDPKKGGTFKTYFADRLMSLEAKPGAYYAYSFPERDDRAWLLIGLNAYEQWDAQKTWIDKLLADNGAPCVLAFAHPFINSSGRHGIEEKLTTKQMVPIREILYRRAATVFVGAHDHDFEQFAPQNAAGKLDKDGGVRSFVVGTGGVRPYPEVSNPRHPLSERFDKESRGFLKIVLYPDSYAWSFLPIPGAAAIDHPETVGQCNSRRKPRT
jgi:calcineurin-like phosphoesterase family protein